MAAPSEETISDFVVVSPVVAPDAEPAVVAEPAEEAVPGAEPEEAVPGAEPGEVAPGEGEVPEPGAVDPEVPAPVEIAIPGEEGQSAETTTILTPPKPTEKGERAASMPEVVSILKKGHNASKPVKILQSFCDIDENLPDKVLDLCLIMDCTGSMQAWIKHCKETLHDVIDESMEEDEGSRVRVAFIGYRDFCDRDLYDVHDFTYLEDDMKKFISKRKAKGGGDAPEDIQGALHLALHELSWLENSIKVACLVADAPCHGSKYHQENDNYPDGNPLGLELEDQMREFSNREILFSCYKITDSTETMFEIMEKAYEEGSEKGGFEFIDIRGQLKQTRPPAHARARRSTAPRTRSAAPPPPGPEALLSMGSGPHRSVSRPMASFTPMRSKKSVMRSAETRHAYSDGLTANLRMQKSKMRSR